MGALKAYAGIKFAWHRRAAINRFRVYLDNLNVFIGRDYNDIAWFDLLGCLQQKPPLADVKGGPRPVGGSGDRLRPNKRKICGSVFLCAEIFAFQRRSFEPQSVIQRRFLPLCLAL
jgi:hypothetical protein